MSDTESPIQFPCDFPIKAMGRIEEGFHQQVIDIVRKHAPDLDEASVKSRMSKNKNYVSVTLTIHATSRAQLDAIYLDLTACLAVIMAL